MGMGHTMTDSRDDRTGNYFRNCTVDPVSLVEALKTAGPAK